MHVRTDVRAGAAANQTEQDLQDTLGAVLDGVQSANELFNPIKVVNTLLAQPAE
jgi:hypothetical protein